MFAVFQPHLYSRTKAFAEQFGAALALADEAVVLDVYPAREEPVGALAGVSGLDVARAAADRTGGRRLRRAPTAAVAALPLASTARCRRAGTAASPSAPATSSASARRAVTPTGRERSKTCGNRSVGGGGVRAAPAGVQAATRWRG